MDFKTSINNYNPDRVDNINNNKPLAELLHISKQLGSHQALDDISIKLHRGQIHGILGENGAGKSTLMNVLYGVLQADKGQLLWCNQQTTIRNPNQARAMGIAMVFQHFSLFDDLTVEENLLLVLPKRKHRQQLHSSLLSLEKHYQIIVPLKRIVGTLSAGEKQLVEIARSLLQNCNLLILDEPTSVLSVPAVTQLLNILKALAKGGCAIVFISHKLREVCELCDCVTVLRGGKKVAFCEGDTMNPTLLRQHMFGNTVKPAPPTTSNIISTHSLAVEQLEGAGIGPITHQFDGGSITGIGGISGNGQRELLALLSGEIKPCKGSLYFDGHYINDKNITQRRKLGFSILPEDRQQHGAIANHQLYENYLLSEHDRHSCYGLLPNKVAKINSIEIIESFDVIANNANTLSSTLSGGNLQKFLVGRSLFNQPSIFICYNPTWGVDLNAANCIHKRLQDLRNAGNIVIVISEDLEELLFISDYISAIYAGLLAPVQATARADMKQLNCWMTDGVLQEGIT